MKNKMQIVALVLFAALAVCLLLSLGSVIRFLQVKQITDSSRNNPYYYRAATKKPKQDNLVGTYILTKQELTLGGLDFLQGKQATVDLFTNGSFTITNLPVWKPDETSKYNFKCNRVVSTTGHWRIVDVDRKKGNSLWGLSFSYDSGELLDTSLKIAIITNDYPPHSLFFDLGAPDSIKVMFYEKVK